VCSHHEHACDTDLRSSMEQMLRKHMFDQTVQARIRNRSSSSSNTSNTSPTSIAWRDSSV
jgi:hypothetical protein